MRGSVVSVTDVHIIRKLRVFVLRKTTGATGALYPNFSSVESFVARTVDAARINRKSRTAYVKTESCRQSWFTSSEKGAKKRGKGFVLDYARVFFFFFFAPVQGKLRCLIVCVCFLNKRVQWRLVTTYTTFDFWRCLNYGGFNPTGWNTDRKQMVAKVYVSKQHRVVGWIRSRPLTTSRCSQIDKMFMTLSLSLSLLQ